MGRICKECKAGSAGVPGFLESGPRPLVFLDAGWKPALPLALPGFHHAPSLGVGEVGGLNHIGGAALTPQQSGAATSLGCSVRLQPDPLCIKP